MHLSKVAASLAAIVLFGVTRAPLSLSVSPRVAAGDVPLSIAVDGAAPGEAIAMTASVYDGSRLLWQSKARFVADSHGSVDLRREAPSAGSYRGVHPMGLIWSMHQMTKTYEGLGATFPHAIHYTIAATAADGRSTSETVVRESLPDGVRCAGVSDDGIVALACHPNDGRAHPGVIVLGGSEGGEQQRTAALLASHGYATIAVAYFGIAHLPVLLREIPVETIGRALTWFARQPFVEPNHIGILGGSKGGEFALLAATVYPSIHAVVSEYGSPLVFYGWRGNATNPPTSSWSIGGHALPYVPYSPGSPRLPGIDAPAFMPLEKIAGPVLFVSGSDDREWPSATMAALGMQRLRSHHHGYRDRSVVLQNTGHGFTVPYYPAEIIVPLGGTVSGNAAASKQAWSDVLDFFARNLS